MPFFPSLSQEAICYAAWKNSFYLKGDLRTEQHLSFLPNRTLQTAAPSLCLSSVTRLPFWWLPSAPLFCDTPS